jgi:release factor glutamine methyltransferase
MRPENEIGSWLQVAKERLHGVCETPALEAQVLLSHVLKKPRTWILAHPEEQIPPSLFAHLDQLLNRLINREPLPYLLAQWEFFGLRFFISPAVLIPRPETELMVETALRWLQLHPKRRKVADVRCGSGCIGITLAYHTPELSVIASDISFPALQLAKQNVSLHHVESHVHLVQTDLLSSLHCTFDLICANLPYIPTQTLLNLPVAKHEPILALDGGEDGLQLIRRLLQSIQLWIKPGGLILLEIESSQKESSLALASSLLPKATIHCIHDLSDNPRLITIQIP